MAMSFESWLSFATSQRSHHQSICASQCSQSVWTISLEKQRLLHTQPEEQAQLSWCCCIPQPRRLDPRCSKQMPGSSSLRKPGRHVTIVTTASLPWRTGTAVNPLLRAAYTANVLEQSKVTLLVPWLTPEEQKTIFPEGLTFSTPAEQEAWVTNWVEKRTGFPCNFQLNFYPARYDGQGFFSIFPVGDVTDCIPGDEADIAILEEPEHLTWFHCGHRWTHKFRHVVGVMHTNYIDYIRRKAPAVAPIIYHVNRRMCSIHCHKVIKLSDAVQSIRRQTTCFCHGVSKAFLEVGDRMVAAGTGEGNRANGSSSAVDVSLEPSPAGEHVNVTLQNGTEAGAVAGKLPSNGQHGARAERHEKFSKGAYFLGKGVWGKGYTELLDLLAKHQQQGGEPLPVDVYGSGEDMDAIKAKANADQLAITFFPGRDHLDDELHAYRVFVNPSTSDVVATTSAEALAMGKWVVCPEHPSNSFFHKNFANCLIYRTPEEFSEKLKFAEEHDPKPLSADERRLLTWEDATERFIDAAEIRPEEWPSRVGEFWNRLSWPIINAGEGIEAVRRVIGAGRNTAQTPKDLESFDPQGRDIDFTEHILLGYFEPRLL